ncbi:hypothetical protein TNCV_4971001 [Trichonephila clavipes]|nr:hypothetical protein TNCV_4971001 [Trichonephila clavipes]
MEQNNLLEKEKGKMKGLLSSVPSGLPLRSLGVGWSLLTSRISLQVMQKFLFSTMAVGVMNSQPPDKLFKVIAFQSFEKEGCIKPEGSMT